ncbi:MAG: hypothetical protein ACYCXC_13130 [Acidovorax defluvii]
MLAARYLATGAPVHVLPNWDCSRFTVTVYAALPSRRMMPTRTPVFLDFVSEHSQRLASVCQSA